MENIGLLNPFSHIHLQWFGGAKPCVYASGNIDNATRTLGNTVNVPVTDWDKANDFIVAIALEAQSAAVWAAGSYRLEWRNKTDGGTFAVLSGTGELRFGLTNLVEGNSLDEGEAICTPVNGVTYVAGAPTGGVEKEGAATFAGGDASTTNQWSEFQFSVDASFALNNKEYEFQIYDVGEAVALGPSLATITMASGAGPKYATLADTVGITDALINKRNIFKSIADTVGITTALTSTRSIIKSIADIIGITDVLTKIAGKIRSIANTIGVTDVLTNKRNIFKSITDTIGITDLRTTARNIFKSIADTVGISDILDAFKKDTFTFIASASGDRDAAGSTLDCSSDLNVLAGDLLVVFVRWYTTDTSVAVAEVGAGNSFTMRATQESGSVHLASGYVLEATEDSTATFRVTWGASVQYSGLTVLQFRPDSGETVTFEDDAPAIGESAVALTGAASAAGADLLAVSGHSYWYWWQLAEFVNVAMAGGEPDDYIYDRSPNNINLVTMYKVFTVSQTDITAEYEQTDIDFFAANILMFKSAGVLPKQDSFTTDTPDKSIDVYDSGWVVVDGAFTVREATDDLEQVDVGTSMAYWGDNVFNDDQYAEVKIKNIGVEIGVGVRLNNVSGGNGYFFFATNTNSYFGTIINGAWADIGSGHGAFAVNDIIRLEFVGTTWTLKKNGGVLDSGTDSTHASGSAGITAWGGGSARVDDFEGGNISGLAKFATLFDTVGITDVLSKIAGKIRSIADTVGITDLLRARRDIGFIGSAKNQASGSGTILDASPSLNVQAGDVLVCVTRWYNADAICTVADSVSGNSFTMNDRIDHVSLSYVRTGYVLDADADADFVGRMTLSVAGTYRAIIIFQFRPASGKTVVLDNFQVVDMTTGTIITSPNITTTGLAEIVIGAFHSHSYSGITDLQIDNTTPDGEEICTDGPSSDYAAAAFSIFNAIKTNINAAITFSSSEEGSASIFSLKILTGAAKFATLFDTVGITDAITKFKNVFRSISNTVGITDALTNKRNIFESIADTVGVTDVLTKIARKVRSISDTIGITDILNAFIQGAAKFAALFDTVGVTDMISNVRHLVRLITDTVGITDTGYEIADIAVIDAEEAGSFPYEFDSLNIPSGNTIVPVAEAALHNANGYRMLLAGVSALCEGIKAFTPVDDVYVRYYFRIPTGWSQVDGSFNRFFVLKGGATIYVCTVFLYWHPGSNAFGLRVTSQRQFGTFTVYDGSAGNEIALDKKYYIDFYYHGNVPSGGGAILWLNGNLKASVLDRSTLNIHVDETRIGLNGSASIPNAGSKIYFDDWLISTTGPIGPYVGGPYPKTSRNIFKVIQDTIATTDVISTARNIFRSISDIVGVIDILTRGKKFFRTIADIIGITDTLIVKFKKRIVDSFGRSRIARVLGIKKSKIARVSGINKSDIIKSEDPDKPNIVGK